MISASGNEGLSFILRTFLSFFLGLGAFLTLAPYFMWNTGLFKFVSIPVFILSIIYFFMNNYIRKRQFFSALFFSILVFLLNFSSNGFVLYANTSMLLIFSFLLIDNETKYNVYIVFYKLFTLSLVPGLVIFLLSLFGLALPWEPLEPASASKIAAGLFYRDYLGSLVLSTQIYSTGIGEIYRFSALYDEPGVVGTVAALLLSANRFELNTISSKIIFLSGFISFSLAFYILIGVYIILKRPVLLVKLLIPVLFLFFIFQNKLKENDLIRHFVFDRIQQLFYDPQSIDNRASSCFHHEFDDFIQNGNVFIGNGAWAHTHLGCDVSSYLSIIYNHGFLGFISIIVFYILFCFSLNYNFRSLNIYPFLLVFLLSLYQRPEFFSMWMVVVFSASVFSTYKINDFLLYSKKSNNEKIDATKIIDDSL